MQASNDPNNDDNNNNNDPRNQACYNAGFADGQKNNSPFSQLHLISVDPMVELTMKGSYEVVVYQAMGKTSFRVKS